MAKGMDPRIKELRDLVIPSGIPWSVTHGIDSLSFKADGVWYRADIWADRLRLRVYDPTIEQIKRLIGEDKC